MKKETELLVIGLNAKKKYTMVITKGKTLPDCTVIVCGQALKHLPLFTTSYCRDKQSIRPKKTVINQNAEIANKADTS